MRRQNTDSDYCVLRGKADIFKLDLMTIKQTWFSDSIIDLFITSALNSSPNADEKRTGYIDAQIMQFYNSKDPRSFSSSLYNPDLTELDYVIWSMRHGSHWYLFFAETERCQVETYNPYNVRSSFSLKDNKETLDMFVNMLDSLTNEYLS